MFELISGFVAIGFAWVMMAYIMFPFVALGEYGLSRYLTYLTDGDFKLPKMVRRYWDKFMDSKTSPLVSTMTVITYMVAFIISFAETLTHFGRSDSPEATWTDVFAYALFDMWVPVGEFLTPVLIVGLSVWAFTYVGRKSFKFKKVLVNHMNNKKVHKGV